MSKCDRFILAFSLLGVVVLAGGCPPPGGGDGNQNNNNGPRTVAVTISPAESGSVAQAEVDNLVTLTATAAEGFVFDGWSGATLAEPNDATISVDPDLVVSITANFIADDAPPSPGDADGDGIRDTVDDCPNTPPGTAVDAAGCPATGVDTDGDGVPDSVDDCGNTTTGATVNNRGCSADQRDTDGDGVNDANDDCASTPTTVNVDAAGCPVSEPGTPDDDDDGVPNDIDQCEDTVASATVDANGCALAQLDTDGDLVNDATDDCPGTPPRTTVDANGCTVGGGGPPPPPPANCGNGTVNAPEQCDDGNNVSGDGCSSVCLFEGLANDACANAITITNGTLTYNNLTATTDGPDDLLCSFFGRTQVESDIWYVYTATCTGTAVFSLCGSDYDTKLAVYGGNNCPPVNMLDCSDDDCGTGVEQVQSRSEIPVTTGVEYLVRVGAFEDAEGTGRLTIACNVDNCATSTNSCFAPTTTGQAGCSDDTCCAATCALDRFCCDVTWDNTCAGEAQGVCNGNFLACDANAGSCGAADGTGGCDNLTCCNTVCLTDPFCCLTEWDATCVNEAESGCLLTCGAGAGACDATHLSPGCNSESCCALVCAEDPFCCSTEWDQVCVDLAAANCP